MPIIGSVVPASEIIGDKWTPQILAVFFNIGFVHFVDLEELGINPRTLSARLLALEEHDIISKSFPTPTSHCEYTLTKRGHRLFNILREMQTWSEAYPKARKS